MTSPGPRRAAQILATPKTRSGHRCKQNAPLPIHGIDDLPHLILDEVALFPFGHLWQDQVPIPPAALSENKLQHSDDVANGLRSEFHAVKVGSELLHSSFIHSINRKFAESG